MIEKNVCSIDCNENQMKKVVKKLFSVRLLRKKIRLLLIKSEKFIRLSWELKKV